MFVYIHIHIHIHIHTYTYTYTYTYKYTYKYTYIYTYTYTAFYSAPVFLISLLEHSASKYMTQLTQSFHHQCFRPAYALLPTTFS